MYQDEFEDFRKEFDAWFEEKGLWLDREVTYAGKDMRFFIRSVVPRCRVICKKWQILNPISPRWTFDKFYGLYEFRDGQYVPLPTGISAQEATARWHVTGTRYVELIERVRKGPAHGRAIRNGHVLQLEFDLTRPTEDLISDAKKVISFAKSGLTELNIRSRARRRFKDYKDHLRVWDQRHPSTIEIEFPADANTDSVAPPMQSSNPQWIRDHVKAARKLIFGGYKELR